MNGDRDRKRKEREKQSPTRAPSNQSPSQAPSKPLHEAPPKGLTAGAITCPLAPDPYKGFTRWDRSEGWTEVGAAPRHCSWCGSIHPEDAVWLSLAGWRLSAVKSGEFLLRPPSTRPAGLTARLMLAHFDRDQRSAFNSTMPPTAPPTFSEEIARKRTAILEDRCFELKAERDKAVSKLASIRERVLSAITEDPS